MKPTLHLFNNPVLEDQEDDTQLAKTIRRGILEYLNEKYSEQETQELLDMASALDPRFKLKYVAEDIKECFVDWLKVEMRDVKNASVMPIVIIMTIITIITIIISDYVNLFVGKIF